MHFHVETLSPNPPSEQLADQVRFAVASGRLAVGEQLPSVRALAASVRVNPNTVSRAWRTLELEGVLEARRGEGMFVATRAREACRIARDRIVTDRLGRAIADARAAGWTEEEVLAWTHEALARWRELDLETEIEPHACR